MSWHKDGPGGRRGYHHGNLREALIKAALDLISTKGPAGFTFAEAARAGWRQSLPLHIATFVTAMPSWQTSPSRGFDAL